MSANAGSEAAVADFLRHLDALAEQAGVELDDQDRQNILQESIAGGFSPHATEAAFNDLLGDEDDDFDDDFDEEDSPPPPQSRRDLEADFDHDLDELERDLGRKLSKSEKMGLAERALDQAARHDRLDLDLALGDVHHERGTNPDQRTWTSDQWNDHLVERAREMDPEPGPDPDREYDLSDRDDFVDYAVQRMQGADFDDAE